MVRARAGCIQRASSASCANSRTAAPRPLVAQEEEIRRAAEERQKREDEEAAKWLGQISVEEAGVDAEDGGDSGEAAAARLVAYIQERKMVSIEEVGGGMRMVAGRGAPVA